MRKGFLALAACLLVGSILLGAAVRRRRPVARPVIDRSFYYWRTTFRLSATEKDALAHLDISRLYLRLFDVEWDEPSHAPHSIAKLTLDAGQSLPERLDLVPVIFVREEVLRHLTPVEAGRFGHTLWTEAHDHARALGARPRELQVDCDWTDRTQGPFFALLAQMRIDARAAGAMLSATIRLHQVKYPERTGVPPVDRGMLMFYNMGEISADPEAHAIFDPASAGRYLARIGSYPLPLDAALPIWSWVVQVRDQDVVGLLQATDPDELGSLDFVRQDSSGHFIAARTAFLHGMLLREGDLLKTEIVGPDETLKAARMLAPLLAASETAGKRRTISLFDLSEKHVQRHGNGHLAQIFDIFR